MLLDMTPRMYYGDGSSRIVSKTKIALLAQLLRMDNIDFSRKEPFTNEDLNKIEKNERNS